MDSERSSDSTDFIRTLIDQDVQEGKHGGVVHTRFPPEPNGHLHIGHAKAICLNFGVAKEQQGLCNLRFDDTNPSKEHVDYVTSIQEDVTWLGFDWGDRLFHASDYFERLYQMAVKLIQDGKAYVDSLSADEIRANRGTLTEPGIESPYRCRSIEENLDLFARMRAGEFDDGAHVRRAKIDMTSPNMNFRDPTFYRIRRLPHYRAGNSWNIYPTYDFAHPLSDSFEGITHSLCTLEFQDHRPLYEWLLRACEVDCHSQQIEFARLNLSYTVMSKRKLLQLVEEGHVAGWDDPRLPTIKGLRRRGYTPESIRSFCEGIGVAKRDGMIEMGKLEHAIREDLNVRANRVLAVLRPLKVIIDNYPEGQVEEMNAVNNPGDLDAGSRAVPFSREIYIDQEDFQENPPKKFFRMTPGQEVRLRYAYIVRCENVVKDEQTGEIIEVHCTYDPETRKGLPQAGRKVKGTIHWVSAAHAVQAEVRLYESLFAQADPTDDKAGDDFRACLNPESLQILATCQVEPSLVGAKPGTQYQFERQGYFCVDPDSSSDKLVFNRTVGLRDSWGKLEKK